MRYIITSALTSLLATMAMADVPRVVTDIPPVHALVSQVMGDLGVPELLLERGASEHTFQMKPSQAASLSDAALVVWIGPELTPWLDRALESAPVSVNRLALLGLEGTVTQVYAEHAAHEEGHDDHAEHAEHAEGNAPAEGEEHHDEHIHEGTDPHAWLSPTNARIWLVAIAGELSRIDPDNAATYTANATASAALIDALDADLRAQLAPSASQPVVFFHDAFGYFTQHYGLTVADTIAEGDAAAPGAEHLTDIRRAMADGGVVCVFPETGHDAGLVEQMTEGTEARIGAPLDPVGTMLDPGPAAYDSLLRNIARTISDCTAG